VGAGSEGGAMNAGLRMIRHQVWTDTRALALLVCVWGLLLLAQMAVVGLGPGDWQREPAAGPYRVEDLVMIVRAILAIVLTALVVQRDPAVGTTAFWRTRPVAGGTMWASKVAWIGLWLVLVPALAASLLMAWLGLYAADAARAGLLIGIEQALFIGFAMIAAALTESIAHFVVAAFAGIAVYLTMMTSFERTMRTMLPRIEVGGWMTPQAVIAAVLCVGGLSVLALAYTGRRAMATGAAALTLVCAMLPSPMMRWSSFDPPSTPVPLTFAQEDEIAIAVPADSIRVNPAGLAQTDSGWISGTEMSVFGSLEVAGAPPDVMFSALGVNSTLQLATGEKIRWATSRASGLSVGGLATPDHEPFHSMRLALGGSELILPLAASRRTPMIQLTVLPKETYQRASQSDLTLDAAVSLRAYRSSVEARIPLTLGSRTRVGGANWKLIAVERMRGGVAVTLRGASIDQRYRFFSGIGDMVVLNNAARRQAICRTQTRTSTRSLTMPFTFAHAGTEVRRYEFILGPDVVERIGLDDQWLAGAELVFLGTEELGTATKPLRIEGLKLDAQPGTRPPA
jgi:hypothetical protein